MFIFYRALDNNSTLIKESRWCRRHIPFRRCNTNEESGNRTGGDTVQQTKSRGLACQRQLQVSFYKYTLYSKIKKYIFTSVWNVNVMFCLLKTATLVFFVGRPFPLCVRVCWTCSYRQPAICSQILTYHKRMEHEPCRSHIFATQC